MASKRLTLSGTCRAARNEVPPVRRPHAGEVPALSPDGHVVVCCWISYWEVTQGRSVAIKRNVLNSHVPPSLGTGSEQRPTASLTAVPTAPLQAPAARPGLAKRTAGFFRRNFIDPLVSSGNPPRLDARGIAVGLAVGFGVPIGGQMVVLGLLRMCFRFNALAAFAFTWVNNPFTMIPMYYGYYYLGSLMLGRPVALTGESFRLLMTPVVQAGHFWESFHGFAQLGWDIVQRWAITAGILGAVSGLLGYVVGYRIQKAHCVRRAQAMGTSYEKLLEDLEKTATRGNGIRV